jgi:hypothetical protein
MKRWLQVRTSVANNTQPPINRGRDFLIMGGWSDFGKSDKNRQTTG